MIYCFRAYVFVMYVINLCLCADRSKPRRETAILTQQMVTAQRAMKHAAWGARKDISAKIKAMKREGNHG